MFKHLLKLNRTLFPVLLLLAMAGCAFVFKTNVDDLALTNVEVRRGEDAPSHVRPSGYRVIVATVSTSRDLGALAIDRNYFFVGMRGSFCGSPDQVWRSLPLSESDISLGQLNYDSEAQHRFIALNAARRSNAKHEYQFWMHIKWDRGFENGVWLGNYDLGSDQRDLCFRLDASQYMKMGMGLTSNELVVPGATIQQAMTSARFP